MSERTTIGGTSYETIGSSSSNLLLKCNGTARIQWGNKLIDLIKNGKIASGETQELIFNIQDESKIQNDGIYILTKEETSKILVCKDGKKYDLTDVDLYISASKEQKFTGDQKKQALNNIGLQYRTFADLQNSGIQDGIAYVLENKTLYTVQNGVIEEFEAKLKTISVEKEEEQEGGDVINGSVKLTLSVDDFEYILLTNDRITLNKSIHINKAMSIGSEGADENNGYRLYVDGGTSILDVDKIRVREGIPYKDYVEISYDKLYTDVQSGSLTPHQWYLIVDFQNHWKLVQEDITSNRPILLRALTNSSFYEQGYLFSDRRVLIKYDYNFQPSIKQHYKKDNVKDDIRSLEGDRLIKARGRITWMCDENGNEANFDFLDYVDANKNALTTLYDRVGIEGKTIFPPNSYNNKLTVYDLYGTVVNEQDGLIDNTNTVNIDFGKFLPAKDATDEQIKLLQDAQKSWYFVMRDNVIECRGFQVSPECHNLTNNQFINVGKVDICCDLKNNKISNLYQINSTIENEPSVVENTEEITNSYIISDSTVADDFDQVFIKDFVNVKDNTIFSSFKIKYPLENTTIEGFINSELNMGIKNSTFGIVYKSIFGDITQSGIFTKVQFKNVFNCQFANQKDLIDIICLFDIKNCNFFYNEKSLLYDPSLLKEFFLITDDSGVKKIQILKKSESTFFRGMIVMHSGQTAIPEGWGICDGQLHEYNGEQIRTPNLIGCFIKAVGTANDCVQGGNSEITIGIDNLPPHTHNYIMLTENLTDTNIREGDAVFSTSIPTYTTNQQQTEATGSGKAIKIDPMHYGLIFIMKL